MSALTSSVTSESRLGSASLGMDPLEVRSWHLLDGLGGVPGAGSCLGAITDIGESLGGVPSTGSCLDVASSDAKVAVMSCDWNCLSLYTREEKIKGEIMYYTFGNVSL